MEHKKNSLLHQNHGVALTMVMFLLFVMTFLGGAIYGFTMQSIKALEYGTSRQKAEYIARSGIEASVFMYQDAMLKNDASHQSLQDFIKATNGDSTATDQPITTNWVYVLKKEDAEGHLYADGGLGDEPAAIEEDTIGYFRVTITNDYKEVKVPGQTDPMRQPIKFFTSVGYCKDKKITKKAYIVPLVDVNSKNWIEVEPSTPNYAIFALDKRYQEYLDKKQTDATLTPGDATAMIQTTTVRVNCGWIDQIVDVVQGVIDKVTGKPATQKREINLPVYMGCTSGNMVLDAPVDAQGHELPIKFKQEKKDHACGFLTLGNLFINADIDIEPEKTRFNSLMFRGNKIVLNGDINMYVYDPQVNNKNGLTTFISGLGAKIARNYRFSTVVLGTPSTKMTTVTDPKPIRKGGLGSCGQVFFGGDVYVNFITRGGATRKYKAFHAGETYYFDGDFMMEIDDKGNKAPYGIDLLKYFLDTAIEERHHSSQVIQQFERTRNFYYNTTNTKYTTGKRAGDVPSMRLIQVETANIYDKVTDTVLPSPGDGSYIIWE